MSSATLLTKGTLQSSKVYLEVFPFPILNKMCSIFKNGPIRILDFMGFENPEKRRTVVLFEVYQPKFENKVLG